MADNADAGAMPTDQGATPDSQTDAAATPATDEADGLGKPGKAALDDERKARREAEKKLKAAERELTRYQEAEEATRQAQLTETEKLQARIAELEQEKLESTKASQERTTRLAVVTEASRLGFADPTDAYGLLDQAALDHDEDGAPTNVKALLEELLTSKPYLRSAAARPSGSIDIGATGGPTPSLDQRIREAEDKGDWATSRALKSQKLAQQMGGPAAR